MVVVFMRAEYLQRNALFLNAPGGRSVHRIAGLPFSSYTKVFAIESWSAKKATKTKSFSSSAFTKHEKAMLRVPARRCRRAASTVLTTASLPASADLLRDLAEELQCHVNRVRWTAKLRPKVTWETAGSCEREVAAELVLLLAPCLALGQPRCRTGSVEAAVDLQNGAGCSCPMFRM